MSHPYQRPGPTVGLAVGPAGGGGRGMPGGSRIWGVGAGGPGHLHMGAPPPVVGLLPGPVEGDGPACALDSPLEMLLAAVVVTGLLALLPIHRGALRLRFCRAHRHCLRFAGCAAAGHHHIHLLKLVIPGGRAMKIRGGRGTDQISVPLQAQESISTGTLWCTIVQFCHTKSLLERRLV
jgi:hypothetical protein